MKICRWGSEWGIGTFPPPWEISKRKRKCRLWWYLAKYAAVVFLVTLLFGVVADCSAYRGLNLLIGLTYAVVVGGVGTRLFLKTLRNYMRFRRTVVLGEYGPPGSLVGLIERLVFTVIVAVVACNADPSWGGVVAAMGGWVGLKMAANWNRDLPTSEHSRGRRLEADRRSRGAFSALLAGVVSFAFATVGGLMIADHLPWRWLFG